MTKDEAVYIAEGLERAARGVWAGALNFPDKTDAEMMAIAQRYAFGARTIRDHILEQGG